MNFKCRSLTHTVLSMWGKIMIPINLQARNILFGEWIPMYRLWLHGLYGLYRLRCLLSPERPLNLITHSLLLFIPVPSLIIVGSADVPSHNGRRLSHDDVIKWKPLLGHWTFVRGIHRWLVDSPHEGQWRRALMISLICAWTNDVANNRDAGDLRRHRAYYDVTVMQQAQCWLQS